MFSLFYASLCILYEMAFASRNSGILHIKWRGLSIYLNNHLLLLTCNYLMTNGMDCSIKIEDE